MACQCLSLSAIFCCPLLACAKVFRLQVYFSQVKSVSVGLYVPKELVLALFTYSSLHLQPKQEDKQSSFLKHSVAWQTSGDLNGFTMLLVAYLFVHAATVCTVAQGLNNLKYVCGCSLDRLWIVLHQYKLNVKPNLCPCGNLSSVFIRWKLVPIVHLPLAENIFIMDLLEASHCRILH